MDVEGEKPKRAKSFKCPGKIVTENRTQEEEIRIRIGVAISIMLRLSKVCNVKGISVNSKNHKANHKSNFMGQTFLRMRQLNTEPEERGWAKCIRNEMIQKNIERSRRRKRIPTNWHRGK